MLVLDKDSPRHVRRARHETSAWLAGGCLAALLIAGLPLFLRMGVWVDSTLYDVAVETIRLGGIHYRDVFDTNLPGMMWLHAIVRSVLGWEYESLRAADLLFVSVICARQRRCRGRCCILWQFRSRCWRLGRELKARTTK